VGVGVAGVPYQAESIVRLEMNTLKLRAEAETRVCARAMSESILIQRKSEVAVGDEDDWLMWTRFICGNCDTAQEDQ